ncbi:MAG: enoyl-CoA hydratase/isomerase family protein [Bdellovibrionales bacterium]|nr:enoyl-CoA hydratase/isomerase family protein [Bdellovibrionales bacterium]
MALNPQHLKLTREHSGKVLRVKINRPEVRNAFNQNLIQDLHGVFAELSDERSREFEGVRAVILQGEGAAFCGGGDLHWMRRSLTLSPAENLEDCRKLTHMFLTMDQVPLPVIGIVHGYAIGGGVGLVSVCDHVIAAESTVFSLSEVKLGLIPACIGPFVIGKIGPSQARSLFLSGERFEGEKARSIGLVHEVAPEAELEARAQAVVRRILEGGPDAIEAAKLLIHTLSRDLVREPFDASLDFAASELANLRVLPEAQEGVRAFLEKRSPSWRS